MHYTTEEEDFTVLVCKELACRLDLCKAQSQLGEREEEFPKMQFHLLGRATASCDCVVHILGRIVTT